MEEKVQHRQPMRRPWLGPLAFVALVAVFVVGQRSMQFLCDDAFIAFRYVSNCVLGHGPVWNPEPFLPVEGYTCFSWVMLLWFCWSGLGVEPVDAVQWIGLFCGLLILWLCWRFLRGAGVRSWLAWLALLAIATHKTFLTWLSSGLETPLYNLCAVAWALSLLRSATRPERSQRRTVVFATCLAVAAALTRPDGLLLVAVSALWVLMLRSRSALLWALPAFAALAVHLVWRWSFYGAWLPNTYYAKIGASWPESGLRYLAAFVVEHGLWWCLGLAVLGLLRSRKSRWVDWRPRLLVGGAFAFHVAYYSLKVGGDHFGFRAFSVLVPLIFVGVACVLEQLRVRRSALWAGAAFAATLMMTHSVGWVHHARSAHPGALYAVEVAPAFPAPLSTLLVHYDRWNAWMQLRFACIRRHTHIKYLELFEARCPSREEGRALGWDERPVIVDDNVGVMGWTLPHVAVLDRFGLNDYVVARQPAAPAVPRFGDGGAEALLAQFDRDDDRLASLAELEAWLKDRLPAAQNSPGDCAGALTMARLLYDLDNNGSFSVDEIAAGLTSAACLRRMAHERSAPEGYFEAFRPNVLVEGGKFGALPRAEPLTDEEIRAIEVRFR